MKFYNDIASHYDTDAYNLIGNAHEISLQQIERNVTHSRSILDLCVGTGKFITRLSNLIDFEEFTGVDISKNMLHMAQDKIPFEWRAIEDSALNVLDHVEEGSQDVILCHFLFDYVPAAQLIPICMKLLKPGGVLSVMTTTKQIFDEQFHNKINRHQFLARFFDIRASIAKSPNIESHEALVALLEKSQFHLVESTEFFHPIVIKNGNEFWRLLHDSGWMGGYFSTQSNNTLKMIKLGSKLLQFPMLTIYPLTVNFHFSLILAQKEKAG